MHWIWSKEKNAEFDEVDFMFKKKRIIKWIGENLELKIEASSSKLINVEIFSANLSNEEIEFVEISSANNSTNIGKEVCKTYCQCKQTWGAVRTS